MANSDSDFDKFMSQWVQQAVTARQSRQRKAGQFMFQLGEPDADGWMARTMWVWR